MNTENKNITVGALALAGICLLFVVLYGGRQVTAQTDAGRTTLKATFNRVDGLLPGDQVRMAGIRIGKVESFTLDRDFRAVMIFRIDSAVKLPVDSSAAIHTDGLFGSKYVELEPGGEEKFMESGAEISFTQDAMIVSELMELIISQGKAVHKKRNAAAAAPKEGTK